MYKQSNPCICVGDNDQRNIHHYSKEKASGYPGSVFYTVGRVSNKFQKYRSE